MIKKIYVLTDKGEQVELNFFVLRIVRWIQGA